jgi:protein-S-isoprenylcysteine O-methyltransferase Ste14
MHWLEHRIPPPVVGVLVGAAMWALARATSVLEVQLYLRIATASVFIVAGLTIAALGAVAFRNASTTVNPLRPESTSSMVVSGVYALTRNPMYVGFALVLVGWGAYLAAPAAFLGPVVFIAFITRFQIIPEERALSAKFGREFAEYTAKVRRWL